MKKKILDGAVTLLFCVGLFAASNIQEKGKGGSPRGCPTGQGTAEKTNAVTAGVSLVLSENSFMAGAEGQTDIVKKESVWVTLPANINSGVLVRSNGARKVSAGACSTLATNALGEAVLAGLAQPAQEASDAASGIEEQEISGSQEGEPSGTPSDGSPVTQGEASWKAAGYVEAEATADDGGVREAAQLAVSDAGENPDVSVLEGTDDAAQTGTDDEAVPVGLAGGQASGNRWDIALTDQEIDLLAKIVYLESCGEPVEGQEAVVEVIFNRMASDLFPDTLYDVLSQNNPVQFTSWKNRDAAQPTDKEYDSIYQVLDGNTAILRSDTIYFSRAALTSNVDRQIGGHSFCY